MCILFGGGYFAKIPTAKALSELPQFRSQREASYSTLSPVESVTQPEISPAAESTEPMVAEQSTDSLGDAAPRGPEPKEEDKYSTIQHRRLALSRDRGVRPLNGASKFCTATGLCAVESGTRDEGFGAIGKTFEVVRL